MSTFAAVVLFVYVPLGLAALGIVARGSGFAFRKVVTRVGQQRLVGAAFASSSVVAPFFLGTVAGSIASGRVPPAGCGDPWRSWTGPTGLVGGVLAVLMCAFIAALFLTAEARRQDDADLVGWFEGRSRVAAVVTGAVALAGLVIVRQDAPDFFDRLVTRGLPLLIASAASGLAALLLVRRARPRILQLLAVAPSGAIVLGWGLAQYPYMLGTAAAVQEQAAPELTLWALTIVAAAALLLVIPSITLLLVLQQRGSLYGE